MPAFSIKDNDGFTISIILTDEEVDGICNLDEGKTLDLENGGKITRQDDGTYYYNRNNKNFFFDCKTFDEALQEEN